MRVPEAKGSTGIWECQPGGWPVVDRPDIEFTYIISGRAALTDTATGTVTEIGPGDLVILPPGWSGRWDVIETVRKIFAIYGHIDPSGTTFEASSAYSIVVSGIHRTAETLRGVPVWKAWIRRSDQVRHRGRRERGRCAPMRRRPTAPPLQ